MQETPPRALARQVMRQMELRKTLRERDAAKKQRRLLDKAIVHRMKNTHATARAIAGRISRGVSEQDAVEEAEEPTSKGCGMRLIRLGLVGRGGIEQSRPAAGFHAAFRAAGDDARAFQNIFERSRGQII